MLQGNLKIIRVVKLLRLVKLARILKFSRMMQRWESVLSINYNVQAIVKYYCWILMMAHWMACIKRMVVSFEDDGSTDTWWYQEGYLNSSTFHGCKLSVVASDVVP